MLPLEEDSVARIELFEDRLPVQKFPMDTPSGEIEPPSKRRKTRKGTHSCWACKKRKERCIFVNEDVTCVSCQKRSTTCISQEFPDDSTPRRSDSQSAGDLQRVESLLQQLLNRLDAGQSEIYGRFQADRPGDRLDKSKASPKLEPQSVQRDSDQNGTGVYSDGSVNSLPIVPSGFECQDFPRPQYQNISQLMYAALPSQSDVEIICRATKRHHMGDMSSCAYDESWSDNHQLIAELSDYPQRTAPPALIVKYLLRCATHLQENFRPSLHEEIRELSAPLATLIASYAGAAAQFVGQDRLISGIESLECIMLAAAYECGRGNMRLSWLLVRRGIAVAQMSGLHLHDAQRYYSSPDRNTRLTPRRMWIRFNYWDRLSSLLLALPMAAEDSSIALDAVAVDEHPLAKLETMHCAILGDIIKRNQALPFGSFETTKTLDRELQKMATILPASWWTIPVLISHRSPTGCIQDALRRLIVQMLHSNLILQVHLPYLLQSSSGSDYDHSRIACVDSARDILTRFVICRSVSSEYMICRVADFIAFTAAVTLVLAYLSRHHQCLATSMWPAHHRRGDLGMIQHVEANIREDNPIGLDSQSAHMADVLHQLLSMETKAADGHKLTIKHVKSTDAAVEQDQTQGTVRLQVPYFGAIVIEPEVSPNPELSARAAMKEQYWRTNGFGKAGILWAPTNSVSMSPVKTLSASGPLKFSNDDAPSGESQATVSSENLGFFDAMPGMFAGADDWALQGIDTTLFSSLFGQNGGDWVLNT